MATPLVGDYMSPLAHSIGPEEPLRIAQELMEANQIRHLPVIDGGRVVGVISLSDLHVMASLVAADPDRVAVRSGMSTDVYTVTKATPLGEVAGEMARRRIGSAIIIEEGRPTGIFTASDAVRALARVLVSG